MQQHLTQFMKSHNNLVMNKNVSLVNQNFLLSTIGSPGTRKKSKKVKSSLAMSHPKGESTTSVCEVNYQLLAIILQKKPNGQLLVAVDTQSDADNGVRDV